MSIQSEIERIKASILLAYEELEKKGATLPNVLNVENLAPTIASLVLAPSLSVTDDGQGNIIVSGVSVTDDSQGNVVISGVNASEENGNVIIE